MEGLFELDEADKACPQCGGELEPLTDQYESSEMVDVVELSYRLVHVKQQKYACRCGGCVETALGTVWRENLDDVAETSMVPSRGLSARARQDVINDVLPSPIDLPRIPVC